MTLAPGLPAGRFTALSACGGIEMPATPASQGPEVLGRLGSLEVSIARSANDVRCAQKLRYRVFYEEMSAIPDAATRRARRDIDAFDATCDHLLVRDHQPERAGSVRRPKVVATCRLLRQDAAARHGGFYTEGEFALGALIARHPQARFLELGRSCVLAPYRHKRTVELLWHGIWAYVLAHRIDAMFGCGSLAGTDPDRLALPLSFLHHFAAAPERWRVRAVPGRHVEMNRMPKVAVDAKAAVRQLPPLIKGYLRLGAFVGDGAVIDYQFGTTDILIALPVAGISARYVQHFGLGAERHAA
jgi:putative hemolysin